MRANTTAPNLAAVVRLMSISLLVALASCHRAHRVEVEPTRDASTQPSPADAESARESGESAFEESQRLAAWYEVRVFVSDWGKAVDHHDADALEGFYADEVGYYGRRRSKAAVILAKKTDWKAEPGFRLEIPGFIDVKIDWNNITSVFFMRSGKPNALREGNLRLVLRRSDGGPPRIVEENEEVDAAKHREICKEMATQVVYSLPAVKRQIARAEARVDASGGKLRFGGIGPQDDNSPDGFSVTFGISSDERIESIVEYSVDHDGLLNVAIPPEPPPDIPPNARRRVAKACRR